MELYIKTRDGQPHEHPIFADNFKLAFPDVDTDNLPPEFMRFERVASPTLGPYEKNLRVQYEIGEDGVCRDVWCYDRLTEEEIKAKQDAVKVEWADRTDLDMWYFDEATCSYKPQAPSPEAIERYFAYGDL